MADVILHDKREIELDLYKITRREFDAFRKDEMTSDEENELIGKTAGLTVDEVSNLSQPDFDQVVRGIFSKRVELMKNPTSARGSTSG